MKVELVYEKACPNIVVARQQLLRAFTEARITPRWCEWEVSSTHAPAHVHGYGSPTILVNECDVSGASPNGNDDCCRVYSLDAQAPKGAPALFDIVQALKTAQIQTESENHASNWRMSGAMLPAVGAAFLPKLTCPACWPAYAGLLSSLGMGFFDYTPYLLPLTVVFLLIALTTLVYGAQQRYGYGPFLLGLLASITLLVGKFQFDSDLTMYTSLGFLVGASLWNAWPRRQPGAPCPACEH